MFSSLAIRNRLFTALFASLEHDNLNWLNLGLHHDFIFSDGPYGIPVHLLSYHMI